MGKEILVVVDSVANERGVDKEVIFEALEAALASATCKRHGDRLLARVAISRASGDYESFRRWLVVPDEQEEFDENTEIRLAQAQARIPEIAIGASVEEPLASIPFGRIAAQVAKQVIVQKVREAERARIIEAYRDRVGQLVSGTVKRAERGNIYLELTTGAEAVVLREETIPREMPRPGDRLRGYLKDLNADARGPLLIVSRTAPELLIELFKLEVPEIGQGLIEVKGAARDPGQRAKIAVVSRDSRIDAVGACVGMRGARVQAVSNELGGERIDIVQWDESPVQFVINAMSPAEVRSIVMDEDSHSMDIAVDENRLSQAIGRGGQNVRLASQLTGWELNILTEVQVEEKKQTELNQSKALFVEQLNIDEDVAELLARAGFSSVEEVAYVPTSELLAIAEFDDELVEQLRNRSRDLLLTQAIAAEEKREDALEASDLLAVEGVDEILATKLLKRGIATREALAELAIDDLADVEGLNLDQAGRIIMAARAPWFGPEATREGE
ncbi:transcription elongation factor NusA [mine drainage metagenome]|uniref:Transcription elongation factor NusA n=2 Tax=mine drainage metagenome TaxID=410659 RepID=T1CKP2_9ZZZZ